MSGPNLTRRNFLVTIGGGCAAAAVLPKVAAPSNLLSAITPEPSLIDSYQKYLFHKNTVDHHFGILSWRSTAQVSGPAPAINSRLESLDEVLSHLAESIKNGASVIARVSGMSRSEIEAIKGRMTAQGIDTWEFSGMMTRGVRSHNSNLINKIRSFGPDRCLAASGDVPQGFDYAEFAENWHKTLIEKMGSTPSQEAIQVLDTIHKDYVSGLSEVTRSFDKRPREKVDQETEARSPASEANAHKMSPLEIQAHGYGQAAQSTFSDLVVPKPKPEY